MEGLILSNIERNIQLKLVSLYPAVKKGIDDDVTTIYTNAEYVAELSASMLPHIYKSTSTNQAAVTHDKDLAAEWIRVFGNKD